MANSSERSKLILHKHNAETEEFKRPNHPDFLTSSELKAIEFSGVRENKLGQQYEFWIQGEIKKTVSYLKLKMDKDALSKAHAEVFAM